MAPLRRPSRLSPSRAQRRKSAAPSAELRDLGHAELAALRRLKGHVTRLLADTPQGPLTPLQRLAAQSLRDEASALAQAFKDHRDKLGAQMGQTKLRSRAASAYAKALQTI